MKKRITNEQITEAFEAAEKDYTKIFNDLLDAKVLSPQRSLLLSKKIGLLSLNYYNFINSTEDTIHKMRKKDKFILITATTFLILSVILVLLTHSVTVYMIGLASFAIAFSKNLDMEITKTLEEALLRNRNGLLTLIENCNELLEKKSEKYYSEEKQFIGQTRSEDYNIRRANNYLQSYLENDFLGDISPEDAETLRKMLQEDLNTKEEYLDVLLDMAKSQVAVESLQETSELVRVLKKQNEVDKN